VKFSILILTFLLGASVAFAQSTPVPVGPPSIDNLFGKYEGTIKGQTEPVSVELKSEGGKLVSRLQLGQKSYDMTEGTFTNGVAALVFGKEAKLNGKVDGEKLTGDLWVGSEKKAIELKRVPLATTPPATPATSDSKFILNGEWEGMADANGQPFPFLLTLRVEGDKVTGNSSSQLGEATVKEGVWKDGKLSFQLEGQNGTISMSATVVEGKLAGEFDYAGQLQGKWVAVRKSQ
jgi:hypothetical protein